jgi:hypothetical protein
MKRKYGRFLVLAVLTLGLAGPALAILGLGDIVFDPTSYPRAWSNGFTGI